MSPAVEPHLTSSKESADTPKALTNCSLTSDHSVVQAWRVPHSHSYWLFLDLAMASSRVEDAELMAGASVPYILGPTGTDARPADFTKDPDLRIPARGAETKADWRSAGADSAGEA